MDLRAIEPEPAFLWGKDLDRGAPGGKCQTPMLYAFSSDESAGTMLDLGRDYLDQNSH